MVKKTENKDASTVAAEDTNKQPEDFMAKKTPSKTLANTDTGPMIYIGPNLPGGTMSAYTVFKNGLPPYVDRIKKETPEIGTLIVPVKDLPTARKRMARHGAEANAYQAVARKYNL